MIELTLGEVAGLCPGRLDVAAGAERITGVKVDSRLVEPGDLFVAVNDAGTDFCSDALDRGAAAALIPEDAFAALAALGGAVRDRSNARVRRHHRLGGEDLDEGHPRGDLPAAERTVAAEASLNNEIGVPLTLCRLEPDTEVCILELSMRGPGQIAELCAFARPEVGVITTIGAAHVEQLGSIDAIARAKSELIDALPPGGTAIVPEDLPVRRDDLIVIALGRARRARRGRSGR